MRKARMLASVKGNLEEAISCSFLSKGFIKRFRELVRRNLDRISH